LTNDPVVVALQVANGACSHVAGDAVVQDLRTGPRYMGDRIH
jgi:hypothetical protein